MPIPGQTITILDPGLGVVEPSPTAPLILGVAQSGTDNQFRTFSRKTDILTEYGQGPLSEAACMVLAIAGGPVHTMRLNDSVAASIGVVAKTGAGGGSTGTVTTGGSPRDAYEVQVEIRSSGGLGAATFRYSLDDGRSFSGDYLVPIAGTFAIANTGVTITFVAGGGPLFFEDGDLHEFDCVAPYYALADVTAAVTAILAQTTLFPFVILTGTPTSAANGATLFAGVATEIARLTAVNRYTRWIMDVGNDTTTNVNTSWSAISNVRIMPTYSTTDIATAKPFEGWSAPRLPSLYTIGARAAASLLSTDLARVADGPLTGVVSLGHDENLTEVLDVIRVTTTRTWNGLAGFFVTNGRLKSPIGSDFQFWQHGRIMDELCRIVFAQQAQFISSGLRTNADGTIDERDAARLETRVLNALREALTQPSNAEGTRGHVSSVSYAIDRTNNLLTTGILRSTGSVRPLGYPKDIQAQLGFALEA